MNSKVKIQNAKVERPILFSGPMVRALLDGRKTQTRRVVKLPRWADLKSEIEPDADSRPSAICAKTGCLAEIPCPYGAPGERLWVRENFMFAKGADVRERFVGTEREAALGEPPHYAFQADDGAIERFKSFKWKPSIHMPRWASRILLEVTDVRVERVQDISEADAVAEGFDQKTSASAFLGAFGEFNDLKVGWRRWLTDAKRGSNDSDFCEDCVGAAAKKHDAEVDGWDDCFEVDHPIYCDKCDKLLHHSLTKYGVDQELMIGPGYDHAPQCFAVRGADAWILHNLAEGIGDLRDEHLGRLSQFGFGTLWNTLNEERGFSWDANPWVWVVGFKVVKP